jgi:hypothetical protein
MCKNMMTSRLTMRTQAALPLLILTAATALAQTETTPYPTNAAEIKLRNPAAQDGLYAIDGDGPGPNPPFVVYCHGMDGNPKEFVELAQVGEDVNFSEMDAGGAWEGTDVFTHFSKLRINPQTLVIQRDDYTFSVSRGGANDLHPDISIIRLPYCGGGYCNGFFCTSGRGNVNLRGTPFALDDSVTFQVAGWEPSGTFSISPDHQVVDMQGSNLLAVVRPVGLLQFKLDHWADLSQPQITDLGPKPGEIICTNGDGMTLIVAATGTAPLSYQWRHNGSNLLSTDKVTGATNSRVAIANF